MQHSQILVAAAFSLSLLTSVEAQQLDTIVTYDPATAFVEIPGQPRVYAGNPFGGFVSITVPASAADSNAFGASASLDVNLGSNVNDRVFRISGDNSALGTPAGGIGGVLISPQVSPAVSVNGEFILRASASASGIPSGGTFGAQATASWTTASGTNQFLSAATFAPGTDSNSIVVPSDASVQSTLFCTLFAAADSASISDADVEFSVEYYSYVDSAGPASSGCNGQLSMTPVSQSFNAQTGNVVELHRLDTSNITINSTTVVALSAFQTLNTLTLGSATCQLLGSDLGFIPVEEAQPGSGLGEAFLSLPAGVNATIYAQVQAISPLPIPGVNNGATIESSDPITITGVGL
ncbi:MAG: hypothetical protein AAF196_02380 [Planctomycetota bacterium]